MRNLHLTFVLCSDSQNIWTLTDRISMESILKDMVLFDWLTMLKLLHIHSQFSTGIKFWKIEHCEWYNMKEFHFDVKRLHAMGWNNCWMNHSLSLLHLCFHKKNKNLASNSRLQTYQILANNDQMLIYCLSISINTVSRNNNENLAKMHLIKK